MNKELIREKASKYFAPATHSLGRDRIEDKEHGYVVGYSQAILDVQNILSEAGDLGDGDYVSTAVDRLPEEFDGKL